MMRGEHMKIVICDDDKNICTLFAHKIKSIYPQSDIKCLYDGEGLLHMAQTEKAPDILLLDIQIDSADGMELARKLRDQGWKSILIFITAYADYVFDAFDVGAFHYLVKPVSDEKLGEVLYKAVEQCRQDKSEMEPTEAGAEPEKCIMVKRGGISTSIKASDIVYAEVFNRKVVIHTTTDSIEYYGKLKSLEDELGGDFYRPHRAYLVHLKYVTKYDRSVIFLQGGQVMMAKQNYAGFVKAYMSYMKRTYGGLPKG